MYILDILASTFIAVAIWFLAVTWLAMYIFDKNTRP